MTDLEKIQFRIRARIKYLKLCKSWCFRQPCGYNPFRY